MPALYKVSSGGNPFAHDINRTSDLLSGALDPGPLAVAGAAASPGSAPGGPTLSAGSVTSTGRTWAAYWITGDINPASPASPLVNGTTLLGPTTASTALSSQQATFSVPAGAPPQAIGWGLCATPQGSGTFYLVQEAFLGTYGGTWPQITDNTPDSGLTTLAPSTNTTGTPVTFGGGVTAQAPDAASEALTVVADSSQSAYIVKVVRSGTTLLYVDNLGNVWANGGITSFASLVSQGQMSTGVGIEITAQTAVPGTAATPQLFRNSSTNTLDLVMDSAGLHLVPQNTIGYSAPVATVDQSGNVTAQAGTFGGPVALNAGGTVPSGQALTNSGTISGGYIDAGGDQLVVNSDFSQVHSTATLFLDSLTTSNAWTTQSGSFTFAATVAAPTVAPSLTATGSGTGLAAGTYTVGYTYTNAYGQTTLSPTATVTITAGQEVQVAAIALPDGVTGIDYYMSTAAGGTTLGYCTASNGAVTNLTAVGDATAPPTTNTATLGATSGAAGSMATAGNPNWVPLTASSGGDALPLTAQVTFTTPSALPSGTDLMEVDLAESFANRYRVLVDEGTNALMLGHSVNSIWSQDASVAFTPSPSTTYTIVLELSTSAVSPNLTANLYSGTGTGGTLLKTLTYTDTSLAGPFLLGVGGDTGVVITDASVTGPWPDHWGTNINSASWSLSLVPSGGPFGDTAVQYTVPVDNGWWVLQSNNIPVVSGQTYTVSLWAKATATATLGLGFQTTFGTDGFFQNISLTTAWQHYSVTGQATATVDSFLAYITATDIPITIADVRVEWGSTASAYAPQSPRTYDAPVDLSGLASGVPAIMLPSGGAQITGPATFEDSIVFAAGINGTGSVGSLSVPAPNVTGTLTNTQLAGPLLSSLTSTNGLTATNPTGVGAASYAIVLDGSTLSLNSNGLSLNLASPNSWGGPQAFAAGFTLPAGQTAVFDGNMDGNGNTGTVFAGVGMPSSMHAEDPTVNSTEVSSGGVVTVTATTDTEVATYTTSSVYQYSRYLNVGFELAIAASGGGNITGNSSIGGTNGPSHNLTLTGSGQQIWTDTYDYGGAGTFGVLTVGLWSYISDSNTNDTASINGVYQVKQLGLTLGNAALVGTSV